MTENINCTALVLTAICLLTVPGAAWAFRDGPPAGRNGSVASGGTTCVQCHGGPSGFGSVQIIGVPGRYETDRVYDLTVRISDAAQSGAGFQISVEDAVGTHVGTLILIDAVFTQFNTEDPNWVNHTWDGVNNAVANWAGLGDAAEYPLQWQAPSEDIGPVTFYAAGNAINNNFSPSGDVIYLAGETAVFAGPVPAVSAWGVIAMTLLLLTVGTLVLARQHRTASSSLRLVPWR